MTPREWDSFWSNYVNREVRNEKEDTFDEVSEALRLVELVKSNCNIKCDCEYGDCYHSKCEQMIEESKK